MRRRYRLDFKGLERGGITSSQSCLFCNQLVSDLFSLGEIRLLQNFSFLSLLFSFKRLLTRVVVDKFFFSASIEFHVSTFFTILFGQKWAECSSALMMRRYLVIHGVFHVIFVFLGWLFLLLCVQVHQLGPSTLLPLRKNRGACGGLVVVAAAFLCLPTVEVEPRPLETTAACYCCYGLRLLLRKHRYGFGYWRRTKGIINRLVFCERGLVPGLKERGYSYFDFWWNPRDRVLQIVLLKFSDFVRPWQCFFIIWCDWIL